MRISILLICINIMQQVVLDRKSMLSVVLSHEKALPTHILKHKCHVDGPISITASILLPRHRRYTLGTRGVYGSRYMSRCHEEISCNTELSTPHPVVLYCLYGAYTVCHEVITCFAHKKFQRLLQIIECLTQAHTDIMRTQLRTTRAHSTISISSLTPLSSTEKVLLAKSVEVDAQFLWHRR